MIIRYTLKQGMSDNQKVKYQKNLNNKSLLKTIFLIGN
nr:MAG TPA: hypothetical protein [Caudoviricetes sp.]